MDPRTHIRNMDQNTQLAALGAVAANEYMEGKNDRADAARLQVVHLMKKLTTGTTLFILTFLLQGMQGGVPQGDPGELAPKCRS